MRHIGLEQMASWAVGLRLQDVPKPVREHAKNQVFSMLGAVHSGYASDLGPALGRSFQWRSPGPSRILPTGEATDPIQAAVLMSAWSMALDYDDVMLGGHTGHSSVLVPLSYAPVRGLSGENLLVAQIAANEIAARINMAAALGPARGQMATHLHLIGAAAALARVQGLTAGPFAHALALAMSYPAKALHAAFLGSDAKALCAAWPIRCGLEAVGAATTGVRSTLEIVEGAGGLLRSLTPTPRTDFLQGLGERWHTETNSYKAHPGSAYLQAAAEAAENLAARPGFSLPDVRRIDVFCSLLTAGMDAQSRPYLDNTEPSIATASFSTAYAVACAIVFGQFRAEHLREGVRRGPEVWDCVGKVRICHDPRLTIEALKADIPIGAALMNAGRFGRLRFLLTSGHQGKTGHPVPVKLREKLYIAGRLCMPAARSVPRDFSAMKKPLGARVAITLANGETAVQSVEIPRGFAGSGDWAASRRLMREKYLACAGENVDGAAALEASDLIERLEELPPREVQRLIELNLSRVTLWPQPALSLGRGNSAHQS